jgi:polar amino acid transport system substrate-binding protein
MMMLSPRLRVILCCGALFGAIAPVAVLAQASVKPFAAGKRDLRVMQKAEISPTGEAIASVGRFQMALGAALADQMRLPVRYVDLPRKRMIAALETGEGDILCGYLPGWLAGAFDWTRPFIPVAEVVVSGAGVAQARSIAELKGKRIGTTLGFQYPELEQQLGSDFVRDDALSDELSLRKMLAGRFDYSVATKSMMDSHARKGDLPEGLHMLVIKQFQTMCAVSRRGHAGVDEVNAAIDAIARNGVLAKLIRER